jgi:uncharacterized membrane protein
MKTKILSFIFSIFSLEIFAQTVSNQSSNMAEGMRSNGKIYVVVAVLVTILLGLIAYLIRIDKNVSILEKEIKQQ